MKARSRGLSRVSSTSHEVAELAGVSRSAVSRTFTPDASVSEVTRRKVLKAAAKLGYQPNVIARSLITRRSRIVGLIMGEWENPFYATMLRGFSEKLQARDYQLMLLTRGPDGGVDSALRLLMQYRVDGIILVSCVPSPQVARQCAHAGARLVIVNRDTADMPAVGIGADSQQIGRDVAELLLRARYRNIALVRGDPSVRVGIERSEAFRATIAAAINARIVINRTGVVGYDEGRRFLHEAMRHEPRPDAIFCSSDLTALGVLDGARIDFGVSVPDEMAVVGLGDIPAASWGPYALTTVRLPVERLIDASIEALLTPAAPDPGKPIVVTATIVQRATVRAASGVADSARGS